MDGETGMAESILFAIGGLVLFVVICYPAAMFIPYISHKKISHAYKCSFGKCHFYSDVPGCERVAYIRDNTEALLYRLHMIERAKKSVILSTFAFHADHAGKDVMAALLGAANRGVEVKIIVDGISGYFDMRNNLYFQTLAAQRNISIKIYNPLKLYRPWDLSARMHDKYLIIDDTMYLLGGRNTFDLFLGDCADKPNIDRELFVYQTTSCEEASICQLRTYFETVWGLEESRFFFGKEGTQTDAIFLELYARYKKMMDQYPAAYEDWNYKSRTLPTSRISLLTNPIEAKNKEPWMWYSLCQLIKGGRQVTVFTPYLIFSKEMYADLTAITSHGKQVECITNHVTSGANPWGCTDYMNQKQNIWKTGIKVYEYMGEHSSHTKALLVDERLSIIGSYNFDMRSTYQDTELMLAVDSGELNALIRKEAEIDKTYSRVMSDNGRYKYGKNYIPKNLSASKSVFYGIIRILMLLLRRFL